MATVELTEKNFDEVVGSADMALIDFWAAWCPLLCAELLSVGAQG